MSWEIKKYEEFSEKDREIIDRAKKDLAEMLDNSSEKTKKEFVKGAYGFSCLRFAKQFADPHKKGEVYKHIYNLLWNWAEKYKANLKQNETTDLERDGN